MSSPSTTGSPATDRGTDTMRAVVQTGYGSADTLRTGRAPIPRPGDHDVLVRVHAAGLDRGTWHLMAGRPYVMRAFVGLRAPRRPVPGRDVAGTVVAVGAAVTRFAPGDAVLGTGRGTFAELTVAREDRLARKPERLTWEQAAALPVSGLTALQGLTDVGRLQPGQSVLITGASGGVGSHAVQIATALGAHVTAVAGTAKLDLVRSLGAEHVVDHTREDFADGDRHYDLILDVAGNPSLTRLRRALTPTGTAVVAGGEHGGSLTGMGRQLLALAVSPFVRQRLTMLVCRENAADLERLAELVDAGTLTPALDRTFPLDQVQDAMRYLEAGRVRGKVAITVLDDGRPAAD
jgi:NADPH:quinone reductase-like Zn-dependent oxidoreductase